MMAALFAFALAAEAPAPVEVPGFMTLRPCALSGRLPEGMAAWVLLDPEQVAIISNPPSSPEGCVRVTNPAGRSLYFKGTERSLAEAKRKAEGASPCSR